MSTASKRALHDLTATEAVGLIRRRETSSLALVEALLARSRQSLGEPHANPVAKLLN